MTVVLDIGNARMKWGLAEDQVVSSTDSVLHGVLEEDAIGRFISAFPGGADRVVATNVAVPSLGQRVSDAVRVAWNSEVEWVTTSRSLLGVTCAYDEPERMGSDRWVAIIAAHDASKEAVCVIDAGTAVTFDAVDASGQHLGGLIMAGPRLAAAALDRRTSNIGETPPSEAPAKGTAVFGRSTDAAVANGAMLALSAALSKAIEIVARELGTSPGVVLAGGEAMGLLPWLETEVQYREHLVLEGLALIAAKS
ncbi:MAG: type III pantothenate kinase [Gammaproteobacteria bacterium]